MHEPTGPTTRNLFKVLANWRDPLSCIGNGVVLRDLSLVFREILEGGANPLQRTIPNRAHDHIIIMYRTRGRSERISQTY
jgi:hypothetical protein